MIADLPPLTDLVAYVQVNHDWKQNADDCDRMGLAAGLQVGDVHYRVTYDDLLAKGIHARTDELTPSVGYALHDSAWTVTPAVGVRFSGNFGGQDIQSQYHRTIGSHAVHDAYVNAAAGFAEIDARADYIAGPLDIIPSATVDALTCGLVQYRAQGVYAIRSGHWTAWLGIGYQSHAGHALTAVSAYGQDRMDGAYSTAGVTYRAISFALHLSSWSYASLTIAL